MTVLSTTPSFPRFRPACTQVWTIQHAAALLRLFYLECEVSCVPVCGHWLLGLFSALHTAAPLHSLRWHSVHVPGILLNFQLHRMDYSEHFCPRICDGGFVLLSVKSPEVPWYGTSIPQLSGKSSRLRVIHVWLRSWGLRSEFAWWRNCLSCFLSGLFQKFSIAFHRLQVQRKRHVCMYSEPFRNGVSNSGHKRHDMSQSCRGEIPGMTQHGWVGDRPSEGSRIDNSGFPEKWKCRRRAAH